MEWSQINSSFLLRRQVLIYTYYLQVFALKILKMFTEEEMERILCGEQDSWAVRAFLHSIKLCAKISDCSNVDFFMQLKNIEDHMEFEHGYDMSSPSIVTVSNTDM